MSTLTNDPIRNTMALLDENKDSLPEGVYLEICNNLKKLYLTGADLARDGYLLNLTNDYYSLLEDNEALRHEIIEQKRELLRANVSRFERVSRPALIQPRGILESLIIDPHSPPMSGISLSTSPSSSITTQNTNRQDNNTSETMDYDNVTTNIRTPFGRITPTRLGRH